MNMKKNEKKERKKETIRRIRDDEDEDEGGCWVNLMDNIKIEITRTPLDSTPFHSKTSSIIIIIIGFHTITKISIRYTPIFSF